MTDCVCLQAVEVTDPEKRFPHESDSAAIRRVRGVGSDGAFDRFVFREVAPRHHCDDVEPEHDHRTNHSRPGQALGHGHVGVHPCLPQPLG